MTQNLKTLGGEVAPGLEKGKVAEGEIIRITLGEASDFMTPEQVEARKVLAKAEFIEMELIEPETQTIFQKTFPYYGNKPPANSIHGKIVSMYGELAEDSKVNLMTKEVGRPGNEFVVWDLVI